MDACERGEANGLDESRMHLSPDDLEKVQRTTSRSMTTGPRIERSLTEPINPNSSGNRTMRAQRSLLYAGKGGIPRRSHKTADVSMEAFHRGCETTAQRLFAIYDLDRTGALSDSEMARMLSDFHGSCGIKLPPNGELEIVSGMKTLHKDMAECSRCREKKGMCRECFCAMLEMDWGTVGDVNFLTERLPAKGAEFEHQLLEGSVGLLKRCIARVFRPDVLQWTIFTIIFLGLSAAVAWIVIQPYARNEVLFSQYGVGISFSRSAAALIIVSTMILLLCVNKVFLELLFRGISRIVYLHMPMVDVHKVLACIVLGAAITHAVAWMVTFARLGDNSGWVNYEPEYDDFPSFGESCRSRACLFSGYVAITGYCMLGILFLGYAISTQKAIVWLTRAFPKAKPYVQNFSFFYWCHIVMAVSFVGILLIGHPLPGLPGLGIDQHGSIVWVFFALPILLFAYQILITTVRVFSGRTHVTHCEALPGNVVTLQCPVPKTALGSKAGEYAKIMIPAVHVREWHPFTLSGDPESGTLQFHIKCLGDWTGRLYQLAKAGTLLSRRVIVQGSFTTRAREYKNFNVVLFVATGIGATPFTSIIHKALQQGNPAGRTYYFHWIVREQVAVQTWFRDLLQDVENATKDLKIVITVWFTGAKFLKGKGVVQTKLFDLTTYAYLESVGRDLITGITRRNYNVKIGIGRPVWRNVFTQISHDHREEDDIGVFFCGAPRLRNQLYKLCSEDSENEETSFKFHSEEFQSW